jgi:hypothetical protein
MSKETNEKEYTAKEILAFKEKRIKFMKEHLPSLKLEEEYSKLKADIAENTLREYMSKMKLASLKLPPEPEEGTSPTKEEE